MNANAYLDAGDLILIACPDIGMSFFDVVIEIQTDITLEEIVPPPPPPGDYNGNNFDNTDGWLPQDIDPRDRLWHELYPDFCVEWMLTSWMDCNGTGFVDSCDIVDFTKIIDTDPPQTVVSWEHVIWVGPTIVVEDPRFPPELAYFEILRDTDYNETGQVGDPTGNWFWEINPNYCTDHYCTGWTDSNENGIIDYCDYILLQDFSNGEFYWYHVIDVRTDIITEPLFVEGYNFHNEDNYLPWDGDPIGTRWHELWPTYCEYWNCTSWLDNGDGILSVCDTVDFTNEETGAVDTFHVEWIGPTITVTSLIDPDSFIYLDILSTDYSEMQPIFEPVGTIWFEKYPNYKVDWYIIGWADNGNGYLDSCDYIEMQLVHPPYDVVIRHIIDVSTDISLVRLNDQLPDCYEYLPGDANMALGIWPPQLIGSDVTFLVNYFRGMSSSPACTLYNPGAAIATPCFWASADANGDCMIIGSDVTKLVNYFRGLTTLSWCSDFVPCWPPLPQAAPTGWPNCLSPCPPPPVTTKGETKIPISIGQ
jgi:hypothetical protein